MLLEVTVYTALEFVHSSALFALLLFLTVSGKSYHFLEGLSGTEAVNERCGGALLWLFGRFD